jgi:hypothetical protein
MARKTKSKGKSSGRMLPVLHADAAGVDIGAEEIFVAVPAERALEPVRSFGTFTSDGIHRRVLDSALKDSRDARLPSISCECAARKECAWPKERRL